jgi:hypothetical protein
MDRSTAGERGRETDLTCMHQRPMRRSSAPPTGRMPGRARGRELPRSAMRARPAAWAPARHGAGGRRAAASGKHHLQQRAWPASHAPATRRRIECCSCRHPAHPPSGLLARRPRRRPQPARGWREMRDRQVGSCEQGAGADRQRSQGRPGPAPSRHPHLLRRLLVEWCAALATRVCRLLGVEEVVHLLLLRCPLLLLLPQHSCCNRHQVLVQRGQLGPKGGAGEVLKPGGGGASARGGSNSGSRSSTLRRKTAAVTRLVACCGRQQGQS